MIKRIVKIVLIAIVALLLIVGGIIVYAILDFIVFDVNRNTKLLENFEIDKNNKVEFYYIPGNATSQNYLQLRFISNDRWMSKRISFERYNSVENVSLINKDSLSFVAKVKMDSEIYDIVDTIIVDLSKIKLKGGLFHIETGKDDKDDYRENSK